MPVHYSKLNPNPNWIIKDDSSVKKGLINFPQLHYYRLDCDGFKHLPFNVTSNDIVCGGSYNIYLNTPLFDTRCMIFEDLYFPYDIDSKYIKVRYGALMWPRINLDAYTYLHDPQRVFIKKNNKFIIEFRFYDNRIELYECIG